MMVLLSLAQYAALTEEVEAKLDEADATAKENQTRLTRDEVFTRARGMIHEAI